MTIESVFHNLRDDIAVCIANATGETILTGRYSTIEEVDCLVSAFDGLLDEITIDLRIFKNHIDYRMKELREAKE